MVKFYNNKNNEVLEKPASLLKLSIVKSEMDDTTVLLLKLYKVNLSLL